MDNTHRHRKFKMQSATTARADAVKNSFIGAAVMFILCALIIGLTLGVDSKTDADIIPEIINGKFDGQDVKGIALLFALSVAIVGAILIGVGVCNQPTQLPEHTDNETTGNEIIPSDLPVATEVAAVATEVVVEMTMFSRERSGSSASSASSTVSSTNS